MSLPKFYLGPDGIKRTPEEYVQYLNNCAYRWENRQCKTPKEMLDNSMQAELVRRKMEEIKELHGI